MAHNVTYLSPFFFLVSFFVPLSFSSQPIRPALRLDEFVLHATLHCRAQGNLSWLTSPLSLFLSKMLMKAASRRSSTLCFLQSTGWYTYTLPQVTQQVVLAQNFRSGRAQNAPGVHSSGKEEGRNCICLTVACHMHSSICHDIS